MTDPLAVPADGSPAPSPGLASALYQMAGLVLSRESVETALQLVTTLAATTTAGTVGAGVTIVDERGRRSRAVSDEMAGRADALQYELEEGPCLTAQQTGRLVRIDDTATDPRWRRWDSAAAELGVRSVLSAPLLVAEESIGAIKVYSGQPGNYDDHDEELMRLFARQAAILLSNTQSLEEARRLSRQLTDALASRDVINQATGVLLAQGAVSQQAAFTRLSEAARRTRRPVREVAGELLAEVAARNADSSPA